MRASKNELKKDRLSLIITLLGLSYFVGLAIVLWLFATYGGK